MLRSLDVAVAQYAIGIIAVVAVVVWLRARRQEKLQMAFAAVVAMFAVIALIKIAALIHTDPRPFVQHPSLVPWFSHPADNGFPSDHTAVSSAVALVVLAHRRWVGLGLLVLSVAIGAARVLAHVHHLQDIAAGLLVGLLAAGVAIVVRRQPRVSAWLSSAQTSRHSPASSPPRGSST